GKANELVRVLDGISERPEAAFYRLVIHLVIGDGGLELRVPVDQPFAAKNQPGTKEIKESLSDSSGADWIESKASASPIATTADLPKLPQNSGFVLILPLPNSADQLLAANLVSVLILFFADSAFDHGLGADAGVVRAGHPERVVSLHAPP